ncbi:hypothetical protein HYU23_03025 [Candidatus Woesearchaeota archaeon]|nr:hypothetical protein [Candidatus Woesearchaeota archaeon]
MGILKTTGIIRHARKGQLQIQETILVIFIFIVLIMFGLIFFYKAQSTSIANDFKKFELDRVSVDFITLGDMPEFSCSKAGIRESCIDTSKLVVFSELINNKLYKNYYFDRWGYKNITIYTVYPGKNNIKCTTASADNCGVWDVYINKPSKITSKIIRDTPVSLYFPDKDQYAIGIMVVEAYNV